MAELKEEITVVSKQIQISENPDSIEIGTPAKGGAIKVYGNYSDPDTFKKKIEKAVEVRSYAQQLIGVQ